MSYLILLRHGESRWNLSNKFTGWVDVPLSAHGVDEALESAQQLGDMKIHVAFASRLERAHETLTIVLSQQEKTGIFLHNGEKKEEWYSFDDHTEKNEILVHTTSILNERYYGKLQGMDKNEARKKFGEKKVLEWRRSYDMRPPGGESLEDVYKRVIPFFDEKIVPFLKLKKNVLLSSHGNTMRVILKYIEQINSDQLLRLDLPSGELLIYSYEKGKFSREDGQPLRYTRPLFWKKP